MKKKKVLCTAIALVLLLAGCELFRDTYYFYSWAVDGQEPTYELNYRREGYTIIMSRGREGFTLDRDGAVNLIEYTEFELKLNDTDLVPVNEKDVDELDSGWHVVQTFKTGRLSKGLYELTGITEFHDLDDSRTNRVDLRIK